MIRAALIGVSGFGRVHFTDVMREHAAGRMTPVAATVINQDEEAERCAALRAAGAELFTDYRAMFEKWQGKIDLCFIPTGIPLHRPMTIAAVEAGANVFVEKPAAGTVQDVRAMQAAAKKAGRFVAVGFQDFYARETLPMKRAIVSGELGKVHTIKTRCLWPRSDRYYGRNDWAGRLKVRGEWVLDSPFNNAVAHQLAMSLFLAGAEVPAPAKVESVQAELYRANPIESADTAALRIKTATGITVLFLVTHAPESVLHPELVVRGDHGEIHWSHAATTITAGGRQVYHDWTHGGEDLRKAIGDALVARLADPNAFVCDLSAACVHTLAVNGAHEPGGGERIVTIPDTYLRRDPTDDGLQTRVVGIDGLIARAFAEEKLLYEVGAPWGKPATPIDMRGYDHFPRGK